MKILVLSERDDCCGPMAAAFLSDYSKLEVVSAGRHPAKGLPLLLVTVMRECLIDLKGYVPRDVAALDLQSFDVVYECTDLPCPDGLQACRELRDRIKNEAFLYYKRLPFTS